MMCMFSKTMWNEIGSVAHLCIAKVVLYVLKFLQDEIFVVFVVWKTIHEVV